MVNIIHLRAFFDCQNAQTMKSQRAGTATARSKQRFLHNVVLAFFFLLVLQNFALGSSDFGVEGLIKIPTARMNEDGELSISLARDEVADLYNVTYQVTPSLVKN